MYVENTYRNMCVRIITASAYKTTLSKPTGEIDGKKTSISTVQQKVIRNFETTFLLQHRTDACCTAPLGNFQNNTFKYFESISYSLLCTEIPCFVVINPVQ